MDQHDDPSSKALKKINFIGIVYDLAYGAQTQGYCYAWEAADVG